MIFVEMSRLNFGIFYQNLASGLVALFDRKLQVLDSPKLSLFNKFLCNPNVNVARFARNIE